MKPLAEHMTIREKNSGHSAGMKNTATKPGEFEFEFACKTLEKTIYWEITGVYWQYPFGF